MSIPLAGRAFARQRSLLARSQQELVDHDEKGADADEAVRQIEDRKTPDRRVEIDIINDIAEDETIDQIADRPADDEGEPVESDAEAEPFEAAASSAMSRLDRMESQLEKAIAEEDYEAAARLRDEIARMREGN